MHERHSPKAAEIVASARELIGSRGYKGFSYADVSKAVGISTASIHHHFPSKADLACAVVAGYREEARLGLASVEYRYPRPELQLAAWVAWWQGCVRDRSLPFCVCAMLASEVCQLPDEVAAEVRGHFDDLRVWMAALFERGVAADEFQIRSTPSTEAMAFIAAVHGAMVSARAYGDAEVFCTITDALIARLRATPDLGSPSHSSSKVHQAPLSTLP